MAKKYSYGDGTMRWIESKGLWEYRVYLGIDSKGNQIRPSFYGHTQSEAKKKYKDYLKSNKPPIEKIELFKDWALSWVDIYKKDKVTYGTYYEYKVIIEKNLNPEIGHLKLIKIKPAHLEKLLRDMAQQYSVSRQRKIVMLLKEIFRDALDNKLVEGNPTEKLKMPKKNKKEVPIFDYDDITKILDFANTHSFGNAIKLLLYTGLRRGEIIALQWTDINDEYILVNKALAVTEEGYRILNRTKGKEDRRIPIDKDLKNVLDSMPKKGFFVISNDDGTQLTKDQFYYRYNKFFNDLEKSGKNVNYKSPHKCRHSFGSYMMASGANIFALKEIMGHKELTTTQIYLHTNFESLKNNMEKRSFKKSGVKVGYKTLKLKPNSNSNKKITQLS